MRIKARICIQQRTCSYLFICAWVISFSMAFSVLFVFLHILQFHYLWLNKISPCTHTTISLSIYWLMDIYSLDFLKYFPCQKMIVSFSESLILFSISYSFYKTYICFSVQPFHFYLGYIWCDSLLVGIMTFLIHVNLSCVLLHINSPWPEKLGLNS